MDFSLVIPTYKRPAALELVLQQLTLLEYPNRQWEVVVVDDGSPEEETGRLLRSYQERLPLRHFRQENQGASAARNLGIRQSQGLITLFIDDDVLARPDLLQKHAEAHRGYLNRLVRGPVINFDRLPVPDWPSPDRLWKHFSMNYLCTSNASLRKDLLLQAGLFDESLPRWEDAELGVRLRKLGVERKFLLDALVLHYKPPLNWEELQATAAKDGASAARLYHRYPTARYWLRSGLHIGNRLKNSLLLSGPGQKALQLLPGGRQIRQQLELEKIYLQAGWNELR